MIFNPADSYADLLDLVKIAGKEIMAHFESNVGVIHKQDGSPVTIADKLSEDILIKGLGRITPDIPVIAEEMAEAGKAFDIKNHDYVWMVDPLDGTKEFVKGTHDFTINIGLLKNMSPVFGLVYLPATGDIYYGGHGIGAFLNGKAVKIKSFDSDKGVILIGNRFYYPTGKVAGFLRGHKIQNIITRGSSLKFCLIAQGLADIYPRFIPTYEWDTAAAHAMLIAVGGDIIDIQTAQRLTYGKDNFLNGPLATGSNQALNKFIPNLP
jgi:3'(2'), 5'-bisphosphate nucleotidase